MKIEHKCSCGATLALEGDKFIHPGRTHDTAGRVYQVEKLSDEWMAAHAQCRVRVFPPGPSPQWPIVIPPVTCGSVAVFPPSPSTNIAFTTAGAKP